MANLWYLSQSILFLTLLPFLVTFEHFYSVLLFLLDLHQEPSCLVGVGDIVVSLTEFMQTYKTSSSGLRRRRLRARTSEREARNHHCIGSQVHN